MKKFGGHDWSCEAHISFYWGKKSSPTRGTKACAHLHAMDMSFSIAASVQGTTTGLTSAGIACTIITYAQASSHHMPCNLLPWVYIVISTRAGLEISGLVGAAS